MGKQAWIQDPKTTNTRRFHFDPKSWSAHPMYFVDSGRPMPGAPPLLKTRSHMRRNDARKLWRELKGQGWKQVGKASTRSPCKLQHSPDTQISNA